MLYMGVASNSEFANIYFVNFLISPIRKNKVKYKFPGIRYLNEVTIYSTSEAMPTDKMAGSNHSQWASSPHSSQKKKLLINDIVSDDHQISEEFFNILGWPAFQGLPGLACAINSNLIKICRLERFQLKVWVFRAPTQHFFHGLLVWYNAFENM